jgi:hypothetical protein
VSKHCSLQPHVFLVGAEIGRNLKNNLTTIVSNDVPAAAAALTVVQLNEAVLHCDDVLLLHYFFVIQLFIFYDRPSPLSLFALSYRTSILLAVGRSGVFFYVVVFDL